MKSQQIFIELQQPINTTRIIQSIGRIYRLSKRFGLAEAAYTLSSTIYHDYGDQVGEAESYNSLGVFEQTQKNWDKSIKWYQKSIDIYRKLKIPAQIAFVMENMGCMFKDAKRFKDAEEYYLMAMSIYKEINDLYSLSNATYLLGNLYHNLGKMASAINCFEDAVNENNRNWDALLALSLMKLEINPQVATMLCQRALSGEPVHQILAHIGLSTIALYLKDMNILHSELLILQKMLRLAKEKQTVTQSEIDIFSLIISTLRKTKHSRFVRKPYDIDSISIEERDLIEIALGYLAIIEQNLGEK
jgi:tetratricopeptide (TPR) repeat protein